MKIFALAVGDRSRASSRLRVWDHLDWLREQGHDVRAEFVMPQGEQRITLAVAWSILSRWPGWVLAALRADRVLVQESLLLASVLWLLRWGKRRCVLFDFSDPVDTIGGGLRNQLQRLGFGLMTRGADHVIVENQAYLRDLRSVGAAPASHWYGPVDVARYQVAARARRDRLESGELRIGWTGSPGTIVFVEPLFRVLDMLAERHPIRLVLIGAPPLRHTFRRLPVDIVPWDESAEFSLVPNFDLGLFVLDGSTKSLRRGAGKLFIYMAAGVPFVATDLGIARDLMQDACVGFAVAGPVDWAAVLERAITDASQRQADAARGIAYAMSRIDYSGYRQLLSRVWLDA